MNRAWLPFLVAFTLSLTTSGASPTDQRPRLQGSVFSSFGNNVLLVLWLICPRVLVYITTFIISYISTWIDSLLHDSVHIDRNICCILILRLWIFRNCFYTGWLISCRTWQILYRSYWYINLNWLINYINLHDFCSIFIILNQVLLKMWLSDIRILFDHQFKRLRFGKKIKVNSKTLWYIYILLNLYTGHLKLKTLLITCRYQIACTK